MSSLYPLKFNPIFKEKIWGGEKLKAILNKNTSTAKTGESWEISAIEDNISIVSNGFLEGNSLQEIIEIYMAEIVGEKVYDKFGDEFPLLIKFIDASDDLSIQVHPNDKIARERHNAYGKTELWYILNSENNANLIIGFNKEMTSQKLLESIENNEIINDINFEFVKENDAVFIPAGRVHAIGKGILLAEIQQTSDITYRIYDWERKDLEGNYRELHTEFALEVIDYKKIDSHKCNYNSEINRVNNLNTNDFFTTNIVEFNKKHEANYSKLDSFVIHICIDGDYTIIDEYENKTLIKKGETVLIPAIIDNLELIPNKKAKFIEVYIE